MEALKIIINLIFNPVKVKAARVKVVDCAGGCFQTKVSRHEDLDFYKGY